MYSSWIATVLLPPGFKNILSRLCISFWLYPLKDLDDYGDVFYLLNLTTSPACCMQALSDPLLFLYFPHSFGALRFSLGVLPWAWGHLKSCGGSQGWLLNPRLSPLAAFCLLLSLLWFSVWLPSELLVSFWCYLGLVSLPFSLLSCHWHVGINYKTICSHPEENQAKGSIYPC